MRAYKTKRQLVDEITIRLLCGCFAEAELIEAGAFHMFEDPRDMLEHIDEMPFGPG